MFYHLTGLISSAIFLLTISGLWAQLKVVWLRRKCVASGELYESPTAVLSTNQFVSSFLAFVSFYLYGICLFDHYLIWPRLAASILTLAVLFELARDRREVSVRASFVGCLLLLTVGSAALIFPEARLWGRTVSKVLISIVTAILAQGYLHQVWVIRATGETGSVSARMHQFFLWKDLSTIAFAMTKSFHEGWPVMLLSTVSGITKVIILWHFRWVRLSPLAAQRRASNP